MRRPLTPVDLDKLDRELRARWDEIEAQIADDTAAYNAGPRERRRTILRLLIVVAVLVVGVAVLVTIWNAL